MNSNFYRESIYGWCEQAAESWKSVRGKLMEFHGEEKVRDLEEQLFSLKTATGENSQITEGELYNQAASLYGEMVRLLEDADLRNDERVQAVPIGGHRLPPLGYPYNALEPVIAEEIMRLHHLKHHQSYVDGLNKAEREMKKARETGDFALIKHWQREAAFHGAGHYLHTIFWSIMSPAGGGNPRGQLLRAINDAFGSFELFKKHFSEAAKNVEAVGWAILVWVPRSHRLEILTAEKHQNLSQWDVIPLLVLDVWEHAYYLQYKNERAKYVENWWKVVNWREVENRYQKARTIMWQPY